MKPAEEGYRVAVVGASSLLGKELLTVLEERGFPICRLVTLEAEEDEPGLPIVDLTEQAQATVVDVNVTDAELDFAFLAASSRSGAERPSFLSRTGQGHCAVIDLSAGPGEAGNGVLSIPFLDRTAPANQEVNPSRVFISVHPAAIVITSLMLRLAAHFPLKGAVAHIFGPVSEIGPRAIEELQNQTINLLSFQKVPQTVFGAQLAFNLLPRLGPGHGDLAGLENRVRQQLRRYLGDRVPAPAIRFLQAPVFYSLAFSLYVELGKPAAPEAVRRALEGKPIRLRLPSEQAPSPVEVAGSAYILVDAIIPEADHAGGLWLWAAADNLRLAAVNAVEIAESLRERIRAKGANAG